MRKNQNLMTLYKFIVEVENTISKKNNYFEADQDYFSIEFKWFQFFNSLNAEDKAIVNELIGKQHWSKTFLIHYLTFIVALICKYGFTNK